MRTFRFAVSVFLIVASMCITSSLSAQSADERAISAAAGDWGKAISDKNLDKTVSFYADDAHMYPPNSARTETKDDIRKVWTGFLTAPGSNLQIKTTGVFAAKSGDLGYETGTFELTQNDAQGHPGTMPGKYVVVWKKQRKEWKAVADIFNTDK